MDGWFAFSFRLNDGLEFGPQKTAYLSHAFKSNELRKEKNEPYKRE